MKVCSDCHQHYIETTCPHCLNVPRRTTNMLGLILGVGLTACGVAESKYGVPMIDNDGVGFTEHEGALKSAHTLRDDFETKLLRPHKLDVEATVFAGRIGYSKKRIDHARSVRKPLADLIVSDVRGNS